MAKKKAKRAAKKTPRSSAKKKSARKAATRKAAAPAFDAKKQFIQTFNHEIKTTLRVLRAFPATQLAFKPHDRSNSAQALAWTFVIEQQLALKALNDEPMAGTGAQKPPNDLDAIIDQFERDSHRLVSMLETASPDRMARQVAFPSGPGKMGSYGKLDFLWFMLMDQIHHRGQLSVYLRMTGGKVPSIYGPSADEPWF